MHQIRVHLADAGYPILGDIVYGVPGHNRKLQKNYNILRQLLHCRRYGFSDMSGKQVSCEAPLLADMNKIIPM
jgi:23S rRNA pseudouridine1911/1915/1917 synthase